MGYGAMRSDQYVVLIDALARIIILLVGSVITEYGRASTAVSAPASRIIEFIFCGLKIQSLIAASHDTGWCLCEAVSRGADAVNDVGQWITVSRLSL